MLLAHFQFNRLIQFVDDFSYNCVVNNSQGVNNGKERTWGENKRGAKG